VASMHSRGFGIELVTFDLLSHNSTVNKSRRNINGVRRINAEPITPLYGANRGVRVPPGSAKFFKILD